MARLRKKHRIILDRELSDTHFETDGPDKIDYEYYSDVNGSN